MKKDPKKLLLLALPALVLFSACKRDMIDASLSAHTDANAAITLQTARFNFLSGNPHHFPVDIAESFTNAGGPGSTVFNRPVSVASDGSGIVWVSDSANNQIYRVCVKNGLNSPVVTTIGSLTAGFQDGPAGTARFNRPNGIALGPDGTLYVADMNNNCIRAIHTDFSVTTFAGAGIAGFNDGTPLIAKFNHPSGLAVDANGTVYVADQGNNMIRRIINKNSVTRWAGQLNPGSTDANGSLASFNQPRGVALSPTGALYVADMGNNKIRKITSGNVTTFAGSGAANSFDGVGTAAAFTWPSALATDSAGNVYVTDQANTSIRMITPDAVVTTIAGGQIPGSADGVGLAAEFRSPAGIMVGPRGNIFITDQFGPSLREIQFTPAVRTLAGSGQQGYQEGTGAEARFFNPQSVATGPDGSIYVTDNYDFGQPSRSPGMTPKIRKITPDGTTSLLAGANLSGFQDGPATQARFGSDLTIAVAPDGTVYVADKENNRIRKISGGIVSTLAGNGEQLDFDGQGANAGINNPSAIAVDASGNIYACTNSSGKLDKITPDGTLTCVHRFGFDQPGAQGQKTVPTILGMAIDAQGHKFVVGLNTVYEVVDDHLPEAILFGGFTASGGLVSLSFIPTSIAADRATGNLYIGSQSNNTISRLTPSGQLTVLAGTTNTPGFADTFDAAALFRGTTGVALGANGILYIADLFNNRIRMMSKQ